MEHSHVISDAVLALVGFFVFLKYINKLDIMSTILWESYILSVALAAFFGAFQYAGYAQAGQASVFFQKLAVTVGAMGLVAASYQLVSGNRLSRSTVYLILGIGFVLLMVTEFVADFSKFSFYIAMICLPVVAALGIWAYTKDKMIVGAFLIGGAVFTIAAAYIPQKLANSDDAIDAYHYLLAIGLLCFGLAASRQLPGEIA